MSMLSIESTKLLVLCWQERGANSPPGMEERSYYIDYIYKDLEPWKQHGITEVCTTALWTVRAALWMSHPKVNVLQLACNEVGVFPMCMWFDVGECKARCQLCCPVAGICTPAASPGLMPAQPLRRGGGVQMLLS
jgi:hypothetical protein